MGNFWKYLIYIVIGLFAFAWIKVVLNAGKTNDLGIKENVEAIKEKTGKVVGDLVYDDKSDEENDNDFGDGEDDLDEDELDEDEILAADWDEEDDSEADEFDDEEDDRIAATTTAKGGTEAYEKVKEAPKKAVSQSVVTTSSNGRYLVIGGSFSSKGNAKTFVSQLEKLGYEDAEIVIFDRAKKFHTVSVARFDSKTDASKLVGALKGKGIPDAYVHKKRG